MSTTETEYVLATEGIKEVVWLRGLVNDLGLLQKATTVFCNNQNAIYLTKNQMYHERTKHIDVKHLFIREIVARNEIDVRKIFTTHNPPHMLTKPIPLSKWKHCLDLIGVDRA